MRVVLGRDVVREIVVQDKAQKSIEQRKVDLLINLRQNSFHEYIAFALAGLPDIREIVNALAPLKRVPVRRKGKR